MSCAFYIYLNYWIIFLYPFFSWLQQKYYKEGPPSFFNIKNMYIRYSSVCQFFFSFYKMKKKTITRLMNKISKKHNSDSYKTISTYNLYWFFYCIYYYFFFHQYKTNQQCQVDVM